MHSSNQYYNCTVCNKTFSDRRNRSHHQRRIHGIRSHVVKLICPICPPSGFYFKRLDMHLKTVHGVSSSDSTVNFLQCDLCPANFNAKISIVDHMNLVHVRKPLENRREIFACSVCSKEFLSKQGRKNHHDAVHCQKFQCRYCNKILGSSITLRLHKENRCEKKDNREDENGSIYVITMLNGSPGVFNIKQEDDKK